MTQHDRMVLNVRVVCIVWCVLLTIGTHLPQAPPVENPVFESPDKLLHFIAFGVLAVFLMCSDWIRNVGVLWLLLTTWVLVDETTQDMFSRNRFFSSEDVLAGALGVFAALCWYGALRPPQVRTLKEKLTSLFALPSTWWKVGVLQVAVTAATAIGVWMVALQLKQQQESQFALYIATSIGAIVSLVVVKKMTGLPLTFLKHKKSAVAILFGTIGIAVATLLTTQSEHIDPWVASMFILVVGTRVAWAKAL